MAIILASGSGTRTGLDIPKQFMKLAGKPVLVHTLSAMINSEALAGIVVVAHPNFLIRTQELCDSLHGDLPIRVVAGGTTRQASSLQGLMACPQATHVLIHDAVRPLVSPELIRRVVQDLHDHDAIDVCIPATDTIVVRRQEFIEEIPPRMNMMLGQTPQAFRRDLIVRAHRAAEAEGIDNATDDCALILRLNLPVFIEQGERTNMKITYLDDIYLAERLFQVGRLSRVAEKPTGLAGVHNALVIGGTQGIGKSVASLLDRNGVDTLAVGRRTRPAVDVLSRSAVVNFARGLQKNGKRFDCVIYCPGKLIVKKIAEYEESDWDLTYDTNLKGVFRILQHVPQLLKEGGHFIVLGSSAYSRGREGYAAYSSSKAALINLVQAASEEWPEFRFNVVSPQRAATTLRTAAFGTHEGLKTLLSPHEIAERVVDILGTELTGTNFDVRVDAPLVHEARA